ncbi:unnamed protein product [Effrenium voratum]|nr:unnamed protein product [Effrenium voratum]
MAGTLADALASALGPSPEEKRCQLIDQLSKSQRTRCVPTFKGSGANLRGSQSMQALPLQLPADGASATSKQSRSLRLLTPRSPSSNGPEDTARPRPKQSRLPGQVLASTKSRTCAASHFQAFRLSERKPLPGDETSASHKSSGSSASVPAANAPSTPGGGTTPSGPTFAMNAVPRLPGRVLEDTQSRTCAAAHLPPENRQLGAVSTQPKIKNERKDVKKDDRNERSKDQPRGNRTQPELLHSPRRQFTPSARIPSPRRQSVSDRPSSLSPERLPRPTLHHMTRKSMVDTRSREAMSSSRAFVPARPPGPPPPFVPPAVSSSALARLPVSAPAPAAPAAQAAQAHAQGFTQAARAMPSSPRRPLAAAPQSSPREASPLSAREGHAVRVATPIPAPFGALPSWASTEAGLSPTHKMLAHCAASRIQRAFQMWWFRNFSISGPMGFRALRDAVVYLQRWWRAAHARKLRRQQIRKLWRRSAVRMLVLDKAACVLQRGWHMVKVMRMRWNVQSAARSIQLAWKQRLLRDRLWLKRHAIKMLLCWNRRSTARTRLVNGMLRYSQVQHEAAVALQSRWRGCQTRRAFEESRDRLERARDRREIIRRKAQLLEMKQPSTKPAKALSTSAASAQDRAQCRAAEAADKSPGTATRDRGGMQSRSKRLSLGTSRVDITPRGANQRPSGSISMTKFLVSQNALTSQRTLDVQAMIRNLQVRGCLSDVPRASPFSAEVSGQSDLEAVRCWLTGGLPTWRILSVFRVECSGAAAAAYNSVSRTLGPERLLWHGTPWDSVANIAQNGFNRAYAGRHGSKLGRGSYFAEEPAFALRFCGRTQPRAIFLAGVLPGRYCRGAEGLVEPPALDAGTRFDSTVDDPANPKAFCVFRDFQAIPLYLVEVASS